jgi:hypothetical protein
MLQKGHARYMQLIIGSGTHSGWVQQRLFQPQYFAARHTESWSRLSEQIFRRVFHGGSPTFDRRCGGIGDIAMISKPIEVAVARSLRVGRLGNRTAPEAQRSKAGMARGLITLVDAL